MTAPNTALAIPTGFDPVTITAVQKLADAVAASQLIPQDLRGKPGDVLIIMLTGHELGLPPMLALQKVYVIKGRPFVGSELLAAKVQSSPACAYFTLIESSEKRATYETQRKGSPTPVRISYTIEEAQRAGLTGKDNWKNHAPAMLRARAAAALARAVYPDLILGFDTMSDVELEEERIAQARVVSRPQAAPSPAQRAAPEIAEGEIVAEGPTEQQRIDGWLELIDVADSTARLKAEVGDQLAAEPKAVQDAVRAAYAARLKALKVSEQEVAA